MDKNASGLILQSKELKYKGKFLSYFIHNYKITSKNKSEDIIKS